MLLDALHQGDVKPTCFVFGAPPAIRRATHADIPFVRELARLKYPDREIEQARDWFEWCLKNPDRLVLVGANSVGVAQVDWRYGFERRGRLDMLASRPQAGAPWEAFRMVRMMLAWAKEQGAQGTFRLDADTGVDFGPFARRLGGKPVTLTRYEIPLARMR